MTKQCGTLNNKSFTVLQLYSEGYSSSGRLYLAHGLDTAQQCLKGEVIENIYN